MRKLVLLSVCFFFFIYVASAQDKTIGFFNEDLNDSVYLLVDKMPQFPGGEEALRSFVANNLQYPIAQCDYEGKVYIGFVINENGKVVYPKVIRSVDPLLDKEAIRVVKTIPDWTPGELNGKKVKVWYTIPVNFTM